MQTTAKTVLAKFPGTCKACGKGIKVGAKLVASETLVGAKGKAAFIHIECAEGKPEKIVDVPVEQKPVPQVVTTTEVTRPMERNVKMNRKDFMDMLHSVMGEIDWDFNVDISEELDPIEADLKKLRQEVTDQLTKIATQRTSGTFKIEVEVKGLPKVTMKEVPNAAFEDVLRLCANRMHVLLVGPAGSGKTYIAETISKVLKLRFAHISCSAGMSEGHLLGRLLPTGKNGAFEYTVSEFVRCYENGGVFLFDEIDAADPNTMLIINSALANGYLSVPNRHKNPVAKMHKDFVCIAAANTFGRGSDRLYVGRNQLDESTLDRFRIGQVEVGYDENVEASLCPDAGLRSKLKAVREKVMLHGMRRVVSTRFMKNAYVMKMNGMTDDKILNALTLGWSKDELAKVA